jgi:hypothetical protein
MATGCWASYFYSDHAMVHLVPTYKQLKRVKPTVKTVVLDLNYLFTT